LAAWLKIASAARTRTDGGVPGSIIVFSSVVAVCRGPLLKPCDGLTECGAAGFPVGGLKLGELHPSLKGCGANSYSLGSLVYFPMGEQCRNGGLHFMPEFLAMSFHLVQSGTSRGPLGPIAFPSPFAISTEFACFRLRPE
jgi:hypothetical protein